MYIPIVIDKKGKIFFADHELIGKPVFFPIKKNMEKYYKFEYCFDNQQQALQIAIDNCNQGYTPNTITKEKIQYELNN